MDSLDLRKLAMMGIVSGILLSASAPGSVDAAENSNSDKEAKTEMNGTHDKDAKTEMNGCGGKDGCSSKNGCEGKNGCPAKDDDMAK